MKKPLLAAAIALVSVFAPVTGAHALTTSTPPAVVVSLDPARQLLNLGDVLAVVTTDGPATLTLTAEAYRHPRTIRATVVATSAGVWELRVPCNQYRLPFSWRVWSGTTLLASATLKCR